MLTRKQRELLLFIHQRLQEEGVPPSFDEMKDALDLKSKSGIHRLITALEERGFIRRLANRARALEIIRLPDGHENRLRAVQSSPASPTSRAGVDSGTPASQTPGAQVEKLSALARRGFTPSIIDGGLASSPGGLEPAVSGSGILGLPASAGASSGGNVVSGEFGEAQPTGIDAAGMQIPVMGRIAAGVPISAIENQTHSISIPPDMIGSGEHFALQVEGESMIEAGIHDGDTIIVRKTGSATIGDIVVALVDDEEATLKRFHRKGNSIVLEAANPAFETRIFDPQRVKVQGCLVGLIRRYK